MKHRNHTPIRSHIALVSLPAWKLSPAHQLIFRLGLALFLVTSVVLIVYFDRDAYTDSYDGTVTLVDAIYYATVTITTTGYGDITPVAPHSRVINAVVVTPLRVTFLVLLVGTTLEVLASQGRQVIQDRRWRRRLRDHTVVIGYGTAGKSAVRTLMKSDPGRSEVVVVDIAPSAVADANGDGYAAVVGDGSRREVLRRAEISRASHVIVALDRDDSAVLAVLTTRQLNRQAHLVVSVREDINASLMRPAGADAVITSSEAVGRLLGLSAVSPDLGVAIHELISLREGLDLHERPVSADEVGRRFDEFATPVVAVVRGNALRRFYDPAVSSVLDGDRVIVVEGAEDN